MSGNRGLEAFASTVNDLDRRLPKSRGRCFDIGIWGGCGVACSAFVDGECEVPEYIDHKDIVIEYGEDEAREIASKYECFKDEIG